MDSHPTSARPDPAPAAQELTAKGPDATGPFTPVSAARGRTLLDAALGFCAGAAAIRTGWSLAPDLVEATSAAPWKVAVGGGLTLGLALLLFAARPGLGTRLGPGAGAPQGPRAGAPKGPRAGALQAPSATPHGTFEPLTGLVALAGAAFGAASALLDPAQGGPAWPWLVVGAALAWMARFARRSGGVSLDHSIRHTSGRAVTRPATGTAGSRDEGVVPKATRLLALAAVALGVSGALAALGRIAARTMPVEPLDHTVRGATLATLVAVGAFAFGRPFEGEHDTSRERDRRALVALVVAGLATFAALVVVGGVTTPAGLQALARRFDLDVSQSGTLGFDLVVSLAVFVLPAFAVGAALHLCASRAAWTAVALGAGLGAALSTVVPSPLELGLVAVLSESQPAGVELWGGSGSVTPVLHGLLVVGAAALAAGLGLRGAPRLTRVVLALGGASAVFLALRVEPFPIRVSKAFERFPRVPIALVEGHNGQWLVEPGGRGTERVSLDHRLVVPGSERARGDRDQLVVSFALLDEAVRSRGPRVLMVGPLTPGRALALRDLGTAHVDRTAGFAEDLGALESFLMRGEARESRLPGELIRPAVARERARSGAYDLVVVPACAGNRPDARPLPTGSAKVVQVLWLPADGLAAHAELPERVLLASSGVEHLVLGVVYGETVQRSTDVASAAAPDGPLWLEIAPPVRAPRQAARGLVREEDRIRADSVTATERLARGNAGHATEDLARGLALHAAAQRASSPFESLGQQVELDREALDRFVAHGTSGAPDVFTRGLWSGLCDVLRAQRDVGLVYDLVEPLEALWGDWPEGALALAWADLEELDPAAAALRLEPYVARRPLDRDLVLGLADALQRDGRSADAAGHLARLVERHPRDRPVRKALARAWLAAGDPRGRDLARELLREDFDDREVWALLSPLPAKPREPEEGNEPRAGGDPPRD